MKIEPNIWKVQISDGYCIWEYEYANGISDISMEEIALGIAVLLKSQYTACKLKKELNDQSN